MFPFSWITIFGIKIARTFSKFCQTLLNFVEILARFAQNLPEFHIRFQKLSKSNLAELRKFADLFSFIDQLTEHRAEKKLFC